MILWFLWRGLVKFWLRRYLPTGEMVEAMLRNIDEEAKKRGLA